MQNSFVDMDYTMILGTSHLCTKLVFLILILSGVHNADVGPPLLLAVGDSTTTSSPVTIYLISIKITNRLYNDTLKDPTSSDHKTLRREVETLLDDAFRVRIPTYKGISQITFSNGSVIANSTAQFGINMNEINPFVVKDFLDMEESSMLVLQKDFTEVSPPAPQQNGAGSLDTSTTAVLLTTRPEVNTMTTVSSRTDHTRSVLHSTHWAMTTMSAAASSLAGADTTSLDISTNTTDLQHFPSTSQPHHTFTTQHMEDSNRPSVDLSTTVPIQTTSNLTSPSNTTIGSPVHSFNGTTTPVLPWANMTAHPETITANATNVSQTITNASSTSDESTITTGYTASHPRTMVTVPDHNISSNTDANNETTRSPPTTGAMNSSKSPGQTINTTTLPTGSMGTNGSTMSHNSSTTPNSLATSSTSSPHDKASSTTQRPTSRTVATQSGAVADRTEGGVPGWGIALLVLAALILLLLLLFFILLVYFCCCRHGERSFMSVSDPTPYMPFNPDIPMYSTQTTIDLPNGKPYDDKPTKNRSGRYVVNPVAQ